MTKTSIILHGYPTYFMFYVSETEKISLLSKLKVAGIVTSLLYSIVLPPPVIPFNRIEQRQNRGLSKMDEVYIPAISIDYKAASKFSVFYEKNKPLIKDLALVLLPYKSELTECLEYIPEEILNLPRGGDLFEEIAQIIMTLIIFRSLGIDITNAFHLPISIKKQLPVQIQNLFPEMGADFRDPNGFGRSKDFGSSTSLYQGKHTQTATGGKKDSPFIGSITLFNGQEWPIDEQGLDHMLSKHGHEAGIDDEIVQANSNLKYPNSARRTRINSKNKQLFFDNLENASKQPDQEFYTGVTVKSKTADIPYNPIIKIAIDQIYQNGKSLGIRIFYRLTDAQYKNLQENNHL